MISNLWRPRPPRTPQRARAKKPAPLFTAGVRGDRLQFPFDGRLHRAAIEVSNLSGGPMRVQIDFYSPDLKRRLVSETKTIPALGRILVDAARIQGVSGHSGVATVTPVGSSGQAMASRGAGPDQCLPPLLGSYSLANAGLAIAHARRLVAWSVVDERGGRPAEGTRIDGFDVRYEQAQTAVAA